MLKTIHISNIVLIEKLNLEFGAGLNVLTGETGAGKSILMDALALALGARSDAGLIRHGADTAQVVTEFDFNNKNNASLKEVLDENGIDFENNLILRRLLSSDGKSRAWINDMPVSVKVLKQIGDILVEIHGQFESHSLLDNSTHRKTLDEFASNNNQDFKSLLSNVKVSYTELHALEKKLESLKEMLEKSEAEREYLEHNVKELSLLNPGLDEEEELANKRAEMMDIEKNASIITDAIEALNKNGQSIDSLVFSAAHILERIKTDPNPYKTQIEKLYEIASSVSEVSQSLEVTEINIDNLDKIEERLFAIRSFARKHRVTANELALKMIEMSEKLELIDNSDVEIKKLEKELAVKKLEYNNLAKTLTKERILSGEILRKQILKELPDLKLEQADFMINISESFSSRNGSDEILFMIKTNPGTPFTPLHKTASGGELARLMLALRVVLTGNNNTPVYVFDEIDTGISGRAASAVGERLSRLSKDSQALVITHSAQVAGFADKHFKIEKHSKDEVTKTTVSEITSDMQLNEIARIISGELITPEALATAKTLIKK